jgi:hypothetical protein
MVLELKTRFYVIPCHGMKLTTSKDLLSLLRMAKERLLRHGFINLIKISSSIHSSFLLLSLHKDLKKPHVWGHIPMNFDLTNQTATAILVFGKLRPFY